MSVRYSDKMIAREFIRQKQLEQLCQRLRLAMQCLSEKEKKILVLRFGLDGNVNTLEQIGAHVGLSRERVRQIVARALRRLHRRMVMLKHFD